METGKTLKGEDGANVVGWSTLLDMMEEGEEACEVHKWHNGTILKDMPITIVSAVVAAFAVYGAFQFVMTVIGG